MLACTPIIVSSLNNFHIKLYSIAPFVHHQIEKNILNFRKFYEFKPSLVPYVCNKIRYYVIQFVIIMERIISSFI